MKLSREKFATCLAAIVLGLVGCTSEAETTGLVTAPPPATIDPHAGHAHPTQGPHHGPLIELGNEEYHAELLHDDQSVTIFILNAAADEQVPIAETEITINTKQDGQPKQFRLLASPDQSDPAGQSSRFISADVNLASHIDEEGVAHQLVLTINGTSYRGNIAHDHDGHNH